MQIPKKKGHFFFKKNDYNEFSKEYKYL